MSTKILKTGNGVLHGVSNDTPQKGKTLTMHDGEVVLAILKLDKAFPDFKETVEDGTETYWRPGMIFDVAFQSELRAETDGEDLTFYVF